MKDNLRYTILYVRISKDDDAAGDSNSITTQLTILQKYANEHGYQNIKVIKDDGYSGTNFNRPGFQEMMALVKSRQAERILVKDLSRLGRNYIETGRFIDIEFPRYHTQFIAVNENFDSNGGDRFLVAVWNLLNELYAMDISNKQKMSVRARSDSGRHITSRIPFGYKLDPDDKHKWVIDEPAAETVRLIFRLFNEGKSTTEICEYLKKNKFLSPSNYAKKTVIGSRAVADPYYWCKSSVLNIIDRQEYAGDTVNFKTYHTSFKDKRVRKNQRKDYVIIKDTQEPVITREEYEKAQARRNANKRVITERKTHLLDGMVFCGQCRNRMYLNTQHRKRQDVYAYFCNGYKKNKGCSAHYIQENMLIEIVLNKIVTLQKKFNEGKVEFRRYVYMAISNRNSENIRQVKTRIDTIQKRIQEIRETETKMYTDKISGKIEEDTFNNITHILNQEIRNLTDENAQLIVILDKVDDMKNGIDSFVQKIEHFSECDITALYCRYSRDDGQESENASITHQKELLKEYAENNGYTNLRYYVDDGYTGTNFDRPDFQRMLDDIENGLISTVIVKDMSRFGRNYILVGKYVEIIFPTYQVNVIGVTDNYDSRKSNNDMFAFQNILSELYAADISKKVKAYIHNKGKNGGTVKTKAIYGYRIAPDTKDKWMIDENVADIVCMVFDKFVNEEWSEYKIAKYLREQKILTTWAYQGMQFNHHPYKWTPDLVRRMLGMQEYAGDTVNFKTEGISFKTKKRVKIPKENWLIFKNTHPAIIPRELFNKAQIRLNRERKPFFEKKREYDAFFRGKCRCSECNCHLLVYNSVNAGSVAYNCKNFTDYKVCRSHHVSEETLRNYFKDQIIRLQNALWNNLREIEEKLGIADISDLQKCLNVVNARIEELNCYIRALFESKVKCEITQDDFAQMSATYSSERNQLQETANELVQKISHAQRNSKKMLHILDYIRNTDFSDMTQEISDTLIERVEVGLFVNRSITHYGEQQITFYLYDIGAIENLVDTSYLSIRERIEEMIPNEIPKGKVHAEDIAKSLGLTYNMLKLALHRENLQFRTILLEKKKDVFMTYLKQGLSAEEICKLIGVKSRENLNSFCWKNFGKSFKMLYKETKE